MAHLREFSGSPPSRFLLNNSSDNQSIIRAISKNKNLPPKVPPRCGIGKMIRRMAGGIKYKDPKIVRARRGWFISLPYEFPDQDGKYKRFEISAGINYIHDLKEREKEAQILLKEVRRVLEASFDL
jgi:hypothetical protein